MRKFLDFVPYLCLTYYVLQISLLTVAQSNASFGLSETMSIFRLSTFSVLCVTNSSNFFNTLKLPSHIQTLQRTSSDTMSKNSVYVALNDYGTSLSRMFQALGQRPCWNFLLSSVILRTSRKVEIIRYSVGDSAKNKLDRRYSYPYYIFSIYFHCRAFGSFLRPSNSWYRCLTFSFDNFCPL